MSLNSNVLAGELDLPVAKRAELLGHSVETNMAYYTYASKTDMDELVELFNGTGTAFKPAKFQVVAPKIGKLGKKETPESCKLKGFNQKTNAEDGT